MSEVENEDLRNAKVILDVELELVLRKMEGFMELLDMQLEGQFNGEVDFTLRVLKNGLDQIRINRNSALRLLENIS